MIIKLFEIHNNTVPSNPIMINSKIIVNITRVFSFLMKMKVFIMVLFLIIVF